MGTFEQPERPRFFSGPALLLTLLVVLFGLFSIRLWYLQIYKNEFYLSRAQDNRTRQSTMFSPRGIIRDRDGLL
ncbi:MAG: penicillin-binding protein 2, partial [Desulfovibrionales bacterium]|nr:penicillin-binding protein 2 [Desulfovibrionales bacterium]